MGPRWRQRRSGKHGFVTPGKLREPAYAAFRELDVIVITIGARHFSSGDSAGEADARIIAEIDFVPRSNQRSRPAGAVILTAWPIDASKAVLYGAARLNITVNQQVYG